MKLLLVFSHLRWDFVFQRPQQLMSRLAADWRIVFVEEPMFDAEAHGYDVLTPAPNIEVLRLHTSKPCSGFDDAHRDDLRAMLARHLSDVSEATVAWFYTPMALPLLKGLSPDVIVYDCMDELSAFDHAPRGLIEREDELLGIANTVFTGGPSLYESKRDRNPHSHCFSSSVDIEHFEAAQQIQRNENTRNVPTVGFFGVIDERLDIALLTELANRRPDWTFCLVGPIVKIDPATLPRNSNIDYLGQQPYERLPELVAQWDVCMMPFAINAATRFISPTKTLEYLAAGKPVVSTPVRDVRTLYADCVDIASDAASFIAACERALRPMTAERKQAIADALSRTSWTRTAAAMNAVLAIALKSGITSKARAYLAKPDAPLPPNKPGLTQTECLIVGAGPTGLSAAYHYGASSLLVEAGDEVGGWCRSIHENGFQFDYAGHIMFSNDPYVLELYTKLLGKNLHWQSREAWVYSKEVYTRYPFQGALFGLPPDVLAECLVGAIEARFGDISALPVSPTLLRQASDEKVDCCGDGADVALATTRTARPRLPSTMSAPANFEEFIYRVWGKGVAKHFAIPYNTKLWTIPLADMETSWLGSRVPLPNLTEMIDGALQPVPKSMGPNARFGYPLTGGFQALMNGFLPLLQGELSLNRRAVRVKPSASQVYFSDGTCVEYENFISTIPLPTLIELCGDEAPLAVQKAAQALRHVSVRCVNLGIGRAALSEKHWIYYPEDTIFHRIFLQGNASPNANPPGGFGLTCEISYSPTKPLPLDGDELIRRCIDDCIRVGIIDRDDPVWSASQVDMPYAYVIYDHHRQANVDTIRTWLRKHNIWLAGRYSEWEYYNSDHAFVAGKTAAQAVQRARPQASSRIA